MHFSANSMLFGLTSRNIGLTQEVFPKATGTCADDVDCGFVAVGAALGHPALKFIALLAEVEVVDVAVLFVIVPNDDDGAEDVADGAPKPVEVAVVVVGAVGHPALKLIAVFAVDEVVVFICVNWFNCVRFVVLYHSIYKIVGKVLSY